MLLTRRILGAEEVIQKTVKFIRSGRVQNCVGEDSRFLMLSPDQSGKSSPIPNRNLRICFLLSQGVDRRQQEIIYGSDFSAYGFCPNAFYLTYCGYTNKNLYELEQGRYYHGEQGESEGYVNQNSQLLRSGVHGIKEIQWFKASNCESLYAKNFHLSGIPDGVITFKNKQLSIVEVKSKHSIVDLEAPYRGDILQACAYGLIYKNSGLVDPSCVSSKIFIIYASRKQKKRRFFEIDGTPYEREIFSILDKMRKQHYVKEIYFSKKNQNKCSACGYRALCNKFSGEATLLH